MSPRYKIILEYLGTGFTGWQRLKFELKKLPVQSVLEQALETIHRCKINVYGSSRTDSGVSAVAQVAHFNLEKRLSKKGEDMGLMSPIDLKRALNYNFGKYPLRVISIEEADQYFNSRYQATSRTYLYKILTNIHHTEVPLELRGRTWNLWHGLDLEKMQDASEVLVGHHDFNSFRSTSCKSKKSVRTLQHIKIYQLPLPDGWRFNTNQMSVVEKGKKIGYVGIEIKARAFLHNQVRIMVSSLVEVGAGRLTKQELKEIRDKKDRKYAPITAPAEPLTLVKVSYGENVINYNLDLNDIEEDEDYEEIDENDENDETSNLEK
eukprot:gene2225-2742_t